jgi:hypothetical protein
MHMESNRPVAGSTRTGAMLLAWAAVGLPLLWGVAQTLKKALALFH